MTFKRQSWKKGQKKRYVQIQPVMQGPFWQADMQLQADWDLLRSLAARRLPPRQPLSSMSPFVGTVLPDAVQRPAPVKRIPFSETNLGDLANLAEGSPLGVSKLYEIFVQRFGSVSKRTFELRLNQLAAKSKDSFLEGSKPVWRVREEYHKLLSCHQPKASGGESREMEAA